jgi:hypothetical protein
MNANSRATSPDDAQQKSEIQLLRERLLRMEPDIDDESLSKKILAWLYATSNTGHQGSLESHVRGELGALTRDTDHKMYPHTDVDKPEDAFPNECEGCPHYGEVCPIIAEDRGRKHLARLYDAAESDDDLAAQLFDAANEYDCHVLHDVVRSRRDRISTQKAKGFELYSEVQTYLKDWDWEADGISSEMFEELDIEPEEYGLDADAFDVDTSSPVVSESGIKQEPPAGDKEVVQAVSAAVEATDEDDDNGEEAR